MVGRRMVLAGGLAAGLAPGLVQAAAERCFAFSYFRNRDNGAAGMRLAVSLDGLRYRAVKGGAVVLTPQVGESRLMRDPCLVKDPHQELYHLVWTTAWEGRTIGYASSKDLVTWSEQRAIPVMAAFPDVRNCWAPEVIYDPASRLFVIFWSSTVKGAFSDAAGLSEDGYNHRLYCTTTPDFLTYSPSRLLFDPGFSVIDATFTRRGGRLYLIIKDERLTPERKYLQWALAASPTGPFGPLSVAFTPSWVEGPTAVELGRESVVFYDRYRINQYGAMATRDFKTWRDVTSEIAIPDGASHGTIIPVTRSVYDRLVMLG